MLKRLEDSLMKSEGKLPFHQSLKLFTALWKEGVTLGVLPPQGSIRRDRNRHKSCKGAQFMFEEIIAKIAASLTKHHLPYMIIGGQAVLLYGEPRLTKDIDITLGVNADHIKDLLKVIQELSLKPIPENIESFVLQTMVLPALDETTGIRVDFIFSYTPYEIEAIKRAKKIALLDQDVCFCFSGRPYCP